MKLDVISILDLQDDLEDVIASAMRLKGGALKDAFPLKGRTLAMIFEKSSTRTRVSFEAGMAQLGGHALNLSPKELQLGRGETISDTAKILSRYVDCVMYRAFDHKMMLDLAKNATVPVINALDDVEHPCQTVADLMTVLERKKRFKGLRLAYIGDGNNVCNSLMLGSAIVGMDFVAANPDGYGPDKQLAKKAQGLAKKNGASSELTTDPKAAVKGADVIYTDTWVSMGMEEEAKERLKIFQPFQVNSALIKNAKKDCIVMHCLPAHRGQEITDEVMDGPHSVIFDQAENRMHTEKAILLMLIR
ncbi:MAG: ornithine carbamoyltransferase [Methanomassiliicoccales archaeon]|nr:ornithine carbamoyltransferase [Methanomassiliicoccales archaeon]MDD1756692.1 ornithine carbamoyltransferase [Methanomassiliicoccales archaeon]